MDARRLHAAELVRGASRRHHELCLDQRARRSDRRPGAHDDIGELVAAGSWRCTRAPPYGHRLVLRTGAGRDIRRLVVHPGTQCARIRNRRARLRPVRRAARRARAESIRPFDGAVVLAVQGLAGRLHVLTERLAGDTTLLPGARVPAVRAASGARLVQPDGSGIERRGVGPDRPAPVRSPARPCATGGAGARERRHLRVLRRRWHHRCPIHAVARWRRVSMGPFRRIAGSPMQGPVLLGLAMAVKQTPWLVLPFLAVCVGDRRARACR